MRVSREQAAQNRNRVLETAGKLFRERGFEGVAVADIMGAAGLTHGGFYGQFSSKAELAAEACARAVNSSGEKWEGLAQTRPDTALAEIVENYLSGGHRDRRGDACLLSTLSVDVARQGGPVQRVYTEGFKRLTAVLAKLLPGRVAAQRQKEAMAMFATLVGAVVLARAVDEPDLSDAILEAAADSLGAHTVAQNRPQADG